MELMGFDENNEIVSFESIIDEKMWKELNWLESFAPIKKDRNKQPQWTRYIAL